MRLYSIWHIDHQRFYKGDDWRGRHYWSKTPRYWQTIDGVVKNLIRIGSDYRGDTTLKPGPWLDDETVYNFKRYANFNADRIARIEIIVTDVEVLGETRLTAAEIMAEAEAA